MLRVELRPAQSTFTSVSREHESIAGTEAATSHPDTIDRGPVR